MPVQKDIICKSLTSLAAKATPLELNENTRLVILSDMHLGNGGRGDDFRENAELSFAALSQYYLPNGFTLILNGDIEELHRFRLREIERAWPNMYELFNAFGTSGKFYKTIGNHDILLPLHRDYQLRSYMHESILASSHEDEILVFHGHQASLFQTRFNIASGVLLRFLLRPLGIKSYSVSADRARQFRLERYVFDFSAGRRIASIIGHTHRPLFESLSKEDALRYRIEQLCRDYSVSDTARRKCISEEIVEQKCALDKLYAKGGTRKHHLSIYNSKVLVPCLFNSGCAIGKSGITCIEIDHEQIALVHWFDGARGRRHLSGGDFAGDRLQDSDYYHLTLKQEKLSYIFVRIRLLSD